MAELEVTEGAGRLGIPERGVVWWREVPRRDGVVIRAVLGSDLTRAGIAVMSWEEGALI